MKMKKHCCNRVGIGAAPGRGASHRLGFWGLANGALKFGREPGGVYHFGKPCLKTFREGLERPNCETQPRRCGAYFLTPLPGGLRFLAFLKPAAVSNFLAKPWWGEKIISHWVEVAFAAAAHSFP
uniref:Uncharacterized protein n=1 Tax=Trypanosoma vivax (strain Y486) TaxID=1055687 RepID=G0U172_TRYVY|nr:hypothetical protein, unlikely [Trypanosoma vivax Y486]